MTKWPSTVLLSRRMGAQLSLLNGPKSMFSFIWSQMDFRRPIGRGFHSNTCEHSNFDDIVILFGMKLTVALCKIVYRCNMQYKLEQAKQAQQDKYKCCICLGHVLKSGKQFGLLQNCAHSICAMCIVHWYEVDQTKRCPLCRVESRFVLLWPQLIAAGEHKNELFQLQIRLCETLLQVAEHAGPGEVLEDENFLDVIEPEREASIDSGSLESSMREPESEEATEAANNEAIILAQPRASLLAGLFDELPHAIDDFRFETVATGHTAQRNHLRNQLVELHELTERVSATQMPRSQ